MSETSPVYLVDITSGNVRKLLELLAEIAQDLGQPPGIGSLFRDALQFDFSRVHVSVQLSTERLRYDDARQRERERSLGIEPDDAKRYALRSREDYEERTKQSVVRDWEQVRGDIYKPQLQRAIVLGDPGFGKSWLLRYEGRQIALKEIERLQQGLAPQQVIVPLFASLGLLARKPGTLLARLKAVLLEKHLPGINELWTLLEEKIHDGHALLLLDGWDEVRKNQAALKIELEAFAQRNPECRIYLTSRIAGYESLHLNAREYELVSFSRPQIEQFVDAFFPSDTEAPSTTAATQPVPSPKATALLEHLRRSPQLIGLARIPLMLTLLCRLYWEKKALPERRAAIYEEILWRFLAKWPREKTEGQGDAIETRATVEKQMQVLEELSLHLLQNSPQVDVWEWRALERQTKAIAKKLGLRKQADNLIADFVRAGVLVYEGAEERSPLRFLHLTFQEYLAARALAERSEDEWKAVVEQWLQGFWEARQPVIELLAGRLQDATPLIELLLSHDDSRDFLTALEPWKPTNGIDPFGNMLVFASRCIAEVKTVASYVFVELQRKAEQRLHSAFLNESMWGRPFQAKGAISLAWLSYRWPSAHIVVREAIEAGSQVMLNAVRRVRPLNIHLALVKAVREKKLFVDAVYALGEICSGCDMYVGWSLERNKGQKTRIRSADQVSRQSVDSRVVEELLNELQYGEERFREAAAWALGQIGDSQAVDRLLSALLSQSYGVKNAAAVALEQIGDPRAVVSLLNALSDQSDDARNAATTALEQISTHYIREAVAQIQSQVGSDRPFENLLNMLYAELEDVRTAAARALGEFSKRRSP